MRKILLILMSFLSINVYAQMDSLLFERDYSIDSIHTGELSVEIDNASFFRDNENDKAMVTGYTLPGLWIQPKMTYQPIRNLRLELGFHSLIYAGKRKYPNYAYQDIGTWKGGDYTKGTHILPYFRGNLQMGAVHVVLGNLFGGQNHHLIEPLYSRELNLTCDPEMGLQLLVDLKHWHMDMWVDWQSFIFKADTHQESFIYGAVSELKFGHFTVPVQVVLQHRGGEIQVDSAHVGVQTVINAAAGVRYELPIRTSWITKFTAEAEGLYYVQQSGNLFSIKNGWGAYARTMFDFKPGIRFEAAYCLNNDYVPVLGDGHYGCYKKDDWNVYYRHPKVLNLAIEYSRPFSKYYAFGARAEMYNMQLNIGTKTDFNFGVFLKANPHFLIKKLKVKS